MKKIILKTLWALAVVVSFSCVFVGTMGFLAGACDKRFADEHRLLFFVMAFGGDFIFLSLFFWRDMIQAVKKYYQL
jgi:hypothetical protein